jgi:N-methylhydantoinase A
MGENNTKSGGALRVAADIGGTFTDVSTFDESSGHIRFGKTLTTPQYLVEGIGNAVEMAGSRFSDVGLFLHGTTVAINAILERTGARTALVTTKGFRDIYEIGRINRPDAYNLFFKTHRPLVDRALRFEINERISGSGEIVAALDESELEAVAAKLESEKVEAVAVLFLHSYRDPAHELSAKRFLQKRLPHCFVTASHELSQEYREFERTSTVAANAYVGPRVSRYLGEVTEFLDKERFKGRFMVVQSTGGLFNVDQARRECIRILESGPAAGVVGTKALCSAIGLPSAIAFDMGGTTAKAGLILNGEPMMAGNVIIGGYNDGLPIQIPMIEIQEVGTGGGSIASFGEGGAIHVGPQSAGASPGPACYGLGGARPTVTDANLLLGRLSATNFLGGTMPLHVEAARQAFANEIGERLDLEPVQVAEGVLRIAVASMANVVKRVTTERGLDARDFVLVAYGGAGPLHAALVAEELRIGRVIVPNAPGHFSAFGMLVADFRRDYVQTLFTLLDSAPFDDFDRIFASMEREGTKDIRAANGDDTKILSSRSMDMRYVGQEHAVTADIPTAMFESRDAAGIKAQFDAIHQIRYGYASHDEAVEIVSLRCSVSGLMPKPTLDTIAAGTPKAPVEALIERRPVYFSQSNGFVETPVYARAKLLAGNAMIGPCLIEEHATTTVVPPGAKMVVDRFGDLLIDTKSAAIGATPAAHKADAVASAK